MPNIKYIARVLTGVRWKKLSHMLNVVHDKCGQSRVHTFFDILWCAARYGAGYYDYVMYGFYDLNGKQRDTYLTRVRNRKVFELMNDPAYNDDFDDKLRFNETFRAYLHRETLNGETATEQQMADFVAGIYLRQDQPRRQRPGRGAPAGGGFRVPRRHAGLRPGEEDGGAGAPAHPAPGHGTSPSRQR